MRSSLANRARFALAATFVGAIAAGCSGGGSPSIPPASVPQGSSGATEPVTFTIQWPVPGAASSSARRRPAYLSKSTLSLSIVVTDPSGNAAAPVVANNPNVMGGTTAATPPPSTTITVDAPIGADTFAVTSYDAAGGSTGGGKLLSADTIPYTIVKGVANNVPLTLNGNLGKIACSPVAPFVSGTAPTFTMVGPAGQISVIPEDLDGNIIIGTGTIPAVTLAPADTTMAVVTQTATANTYVVNPLVVGTAVTLNASGTNLAGAAVTSTCTVTRQLAMYVSNHGINGIGNSVTGALAANSSITIYPATATGNATPTAVIAGSNTEQNGVEYDAVDSAGNLFVTNQGPIPSSTYGPNAGYVAIYGPAASGNVAPVSSIANLNTPQGLAFDSNGKLYVMAIDRILEYPGTQDGVTNPAVPSNTIAGSATNLFSCYGLAVGADFRVYAACSIYIQSYAPATNGNVAPDEVAVLGNTAMTFSSQSWLGIAVDASSNVVVPASNNNLNLLDAYTETQITAGTPGTVATPVPSSIIKGTGFNEPYGIFVDSNGQYYLANYGASSIEVFSSFTTLETGIATATISGAATGLNQPYDVTVR